MSKIKELFTFQYDNKFTLFKQKSAKGFFIQFFKYLLIISALTLGLFIILRNMFFVLNIQVNAQLIAFVIAGTQGISLIFALINIIRNLYLSQDNELLMVLPVTFNQLFVSKIMIIYLTDLLFNVLYILPIFLVLGFLGALPITYFVMLVILIPLFPLLPIAVGSVLSVPIMYLIKFLKKNTTLLLISMLILVAAVFVGYMALVTQISGFINIAEQQIEASIQINASIKNVGQQIFAFYQLAQSMFSFGYIYYPLLYLVATIILVCLCFLIIKPFYYRIATINLDNTTSNKTKYKKFKKRKPFTEILLNEFRQVFRSPGNIFQYFLFALFMPLIVFTYDKLLTSIAVNQTGQNMIIGAHFLIVCISALMSNTISSTAISKDGKNFYISKVIPVSYYTQAASKITFNAIITIGAVFVTTITSLFFSNLSPGVILLTGAVVSILSFGHICHSFDMDLQHPVLDWYDNSEISTIGKSTTKSIMWGLVLSVVLFLIMVFLQNIGLYIALLFSILYCIARVYMLYIKIKHYYNIMEI